jgi:membrane protein YqaA with SNARE-associated domain
LRPAPLDEELSEDAGAFVRRHLKSSVLALGAFLILMLAVGLWLKEPLAALAMQAAERLGRVGLALVVLCTDTITSPVPPDVALVVISESPLHSSAWWFVPLLGAVSAMGGNLGYLLARRLGESRFVAAMLGRYRERAAARVARFGGIAVALSATTPLPFSVTCWTAGLLRVPWHTVFRASLLRIPRFVVYYALIAQSAVLVRAWL